MIELGLQPSEFWRLTLCQFNELSKQYNLQRQIADYRAGIVASAIVNVNLDPKKSTPVEWTQFFPQWRRETTEEERQAEQQNLYLWLSALAENGEVH